MIRIFFPRMKEKVSADKTEIENRQLISNYCNKNLFLWMCWSLFFMVYENLQCVNVPAEMNRLDLCFASVGQYFFLFVVMMSVSISKILSLTEEEAFRVCKAVNKDYDDKYY